MGLFPCCHCWHIKNTNACITRDGPCGLENCQLALTHRDGAKVDFSSQWSSANCLPITVLLSSDFIVVSMLAAFRTAHTGLFAQGLNNSVLAVGSSSHSLSEKINCSLIAYLFSIQPRLICF